MTRPGKSAHGPSRVDGEQLPEYHDAYYAANRERILARNRANRKAKRYHRLNSLDYRAMAVSLLRERDEGVCGLCGKPVAEGDESPDHIRQRAHGGGNDAANLRLTHRVCNRRRPKRRS